MCSFSSVQCCRNNRKIKGQYMVSIQEKILINTPKNWFPDQVLYKLFIFSPFLCSKDKLTNLKNQLLVKLRKSERGKDKTDTQKKKIRFPSLIFTCEISNLQQFTDENRFSLIEIKFCNLEYHIHSIFFFYIFISF